MNNVTLDPIQKRDIHSALCCGQGLAGAAAAAQIDKRTLQRLVDTLGDSFLTGLVDPLTITKAEYDSLYYPYRHTGERLSQQAERRTYAEALERKLGDSLRLRLQTEEEKREAAEEKAKALAERRAAAAERRRELEEEKREAAEAEVQKLQRQFYGDSYRSLYPLIHALVIAYGSEEEYLLGIGGQGKEAQREFRRKVEGVMVGREYISATQYETYKRYGGGLKEAQRIVADAVKLVKKYTEGGL